MFYEMTLWGFGLNPVVCPTAPRRKKSVVVKTTQNAPHCADTNVRMHIDVKQGLSYGPEAISLCLRFLFYIFFGGNTIKKHPKVFFIFVSGILQIHARFFHAGSFDIVNHGGFYDSGVTYNQIRIRQIHRTYLDRFG